MELIFHLDEINAAAKKFITKMNGNKVFAFHGEMGAGKTTFIHAICSELGVEENISSPTFSIIQEYQAPDQKVIFHIDLYRLKDIEEAINAGVEDAVYSGELCFIEWPEKISGILPPQTVHVFIDPLSNSERKIVCKFP